MLITTTPQAVDLFERISDYNDAVQSGRVANIALARAKGEIYGSFPSIKDKPDGEKLWVDGRYCLDDEKLRGALNSNGAGEAQLAEILRALEGAATQMRAEASLAQMLAQNLTKVTEELDAYIKLRAGSTK